MKKGDECTDTTEKHNTILTHIPQEDHSSSPKRRLNPEKGEKNSRKERGAFQAKKEGGRDRYLLRNFFTGREKKTPGRKRVGQGKTALGLGRGNEAHIGSSVNHAREPPEKTANGSKHIRGIEYGGGKPDRRDGGKMLPRAQQS